MLTQPATGRRRVTCCTSCRIRRQVLTRQLRLRLTWSAEWRRLAERGETTADEAAREQAALADDIRELRAALGEDGT